MCSHDRSQQVLWKYVRKAGKKKGKIEPKKSKARRMGVPLSLLRHQLSQPCMVPFSLGGCQAVPGSCRSLSPAGQCPGLLLSKALSPCLSPPTDPVMSFSFTLRKVGRVIDFKQLSLAFCLAKILESREFRGLKHLSEI